MIELVVARYAEDIRWLSNIPAPIRVTVYDKSGQPQVLPPPPRPRRGESPGEREVLALPNVGREAHTYLHHVAARYGDLADVTVFCQGRPFDHAFDFHATLRTLAATPPNPNEWRWLGHMIDTESRDGHLFREWTKNPERDSLDLPGFHRALLGDDGSDSYAFVLGGQFAAGRGLLRQRPVEFWQRALELSAAWPHAAHCFERMWDRVLGAPGPSPELMAGRSTLSLKPSSTSRK